MVSHGIKVVNEGKTITGVDIRNFLLNSDYLSAKHHSTLNGTITINAGSSSGYFEADHGLGYVPAFLVYQDGSLASSLNVSAYATTSKVRVTWTLDAPYNQTTSTLYAEEAYYEDSIIGRGIVAGNRVGATGSGVRFINVAIPQGQTLVSTILRWRVGTFETDYSGDIKFKIYGIDEDNTGSFGNPMGRDKTTAVRTKSQANVGDWFEFSDDVTSLAQEIVNRGGWTTGNAMGFLFNDNSSPEHRYLLNQYIINSDIDHISMDITYVAPGSTSSDFKIVVLKDKIA